MTYDEILKMAEEKNARQRDTGSFNPTLRAEQGIRELQIMNFSRPLH